MELKLSVWERITLSNVPGSLKSVNIATLRKASKAIDVLELSPDE